MVLQPEVNPTKLTRRFFPFFAIKLSHFKVQLIFSYATTTQALQQKSEKQRNQSLVELTPGLSLKYFLYLISNCES
jgi:hypothetical protein